VIESAGFARTVLGVDASARLYATSKLFFAYALGNALFAGLRLGGTVILDGEWPGAERVVQIAERHRPTVMFSVPTLYLKILQAGITRRLARVGVRHFVSAGEALPGSVHRLWEEATGIAPVSGYGATETIALVFHCGSESGLLTPSPLVEVRPREAPDQTGETPRRIWLRHTSVALGYWRRPQAESDSFSEGWFSPGDVFRRTGAGTLEFCGRDDMLENFRSNAIEVEQLRAPAGSVTACRRVGTGRPASRSRCSSWQPGRGPRARIEAGIAALPKIKQPRLVKWIAEMPVTATGKLQRRKLKDLYLVHEVA
jgi:acyl-coenzyme A synthetase/AMP-(fatty) acid ligase